MRRSEKTFPGRELKLASVRRQCSGIQTRGRRATSDKRTANTAWRLITVVTETGIATIVHSDIQIPYLLCGLKESRLHGVVVPTKLPARRRVII